MWSHKCQIEGQDPCPGAAGYAFVYTEAAKDVDDCLCCKVTLLVPAQLAGNWDPQVFFCKAAF